MVVAARNVPYVNDVPIPRNANRPTESELTESERTASERTESEPTASKEIIRVPRTLFSWVLNAYESKEGLKPHLSYRISTWEVDE
jgi:hypothetical protein